MPSAVQKISAYTFDPAAATVTFTGLVSVNASRVLSIYDETLGAPLYAITQAPQSSVSGNVLTLPPGSVPEGAQSSDALGIVYDVTPPHGYALLSFDTRSAFPATGVSHTWYLALDTGQAYVWDESAFGAV